VLSIEFVLRICCRLVGNWIGEEEKGSPMDEWWRCNTSYEYQKRERE